MSRGITVVFLLAIILFGTILRVYRIGEESFWFDEMASVRIASSDWLK